MQHRYQHDVWTFENVLGDREFFNKNWEPKPNELNELKFLEEKEKEGWELVTVMYHEEPGTGCGTVKFYMKYQIRD
tara:strand:+ start:254 stop:481 length:228 start_codon:yes stop_codon:yes gene_type:complete